MKLIIEQFFRRAFTQHFRDGSSIAPMGRDELFFEAANGRSLIVYIFVTRSAVPFDRIVALDSLKKWNDGTLVSEEDKSLILGHVLGYRFLRWSNIGVEGAKDSPIQSLRGMLRETR